MPWKKIVCAVDFSTFSREALRVAVDEAEVSGAELFVAHVWTPPVYFMGETIGMPAAILSDLIAIAEKELARWKGDAATYGAKRVRSVFLTGAPWNEIVNLATSDPEIE